MNAGDTLGRALRQTVYDWRKRFGRTILAAGAKSDADHMRDVTIARATVVLAAETTALALMHGNVTEERRAKLLDELHATYLSTVEKTCVEIGARVTEAIEKRDQQAKGES